MAYLDISLLQEGTWESPCLTDYSLLRSTYEGNLSWLGKQTWPLSASFGPGKRRLFFHTRTLHCIFNPTQGTIRA